jgi:prepilin-type N-terminal cleavage/methylation domain-containing protein
MALARSHCSNEAGFSLMEVLIAMGVMAIALVSLAQLFAISTSANHASKTTTFATMLAQQKMEQLRGLTWGFDTIGLPISDVTTDSSVVPQAAGCPAATNAGQGTGLSPSAGGTLAGNVAGWVDYLDINGCLLGGGGAIPNRTVYIRRWSVEPLPTNPNNTLILQVLVTRRIDRGTADQGNVMRLNEEARVMSIKTRKYK